MQLLNRMIHSCQVVSSSRLLVKIHNLFIIVYSNTIVSLYYSYVVLIFIVCCSTCSDGAWDCGDQDCKTSVMCPNNQVYKEKIQRCGRTCSTYLKKDFCNPNEPFIDGCTCEDDQVLDQDVSINIFITHSLNKSHLMSHQF